MAAATSTRVLFERPVCETINPNVGKARPTDPNYQEVQQFCRDIRAEGFDERAVVTMLKLYTSGQPATYDMAKPENWGIVIGLRTSSFISPGSVYLPIKVQWVKDGSISEHWPENLMLIHRAMQQHDLGKHFDLMVAM